MNNYYFSFLLTYDLITQTIIKYYQHIKLQSWQNVHLLGLKRKKSRNRTHS